MTDKKHDPPDHSEDFQKRLSEMLSNANFTFMAGPQPQRPQEEPETPEAPESPERSEETLRRIREFNLKPHGIKEYLDRFVIRQDEAKKVLSVAICDHYNHVRRCMESPALADKEYSKHNVILVGPSGVGKTYLLRCIARLIGVPFVKADATKFSETGYVGHDVEDLARDLVRMADGNTELAQYGMIYLDEIDKIASSPMSSGRDVSGRGVQVNLLKLMEETDVSLHSQTDLVGQIQAIMSNQKGKKQERTINTRHMLFIASGAFDNLPELVKRRVDSSSIGFMSDGRSQRTDSDYMKLAGTGDFIRYGFEPEFIGRLPVRVVCEPLTAEDLETILLKAEDSVLRQYEDDFAGYGIDLTVRQDATREIAQQAEKEKTGARGLMTVLERTLRHCKFELPSTLVTSFEATRETVLDPVTSLQTLLEKEQPEELELAVLEIAQFAEQFQTEHGFKLTFLQGAVSELAREAAASGRSVTDVCEEKLHDFQHGLRLIAQNTGNGPFKITKRVIQNPGRELSRMIAESFRRKESEESK
ncbi:MAG: AAA family ATPase [Lentisphaerales bacterium]|nr:MAG: AAA family ATPase [Lentisphaerales bacterium]